MICLKLIFYPGFLKSINPLDVSDKLIILSLVDSVTRFQEQVKR